jgi:anti-anti-sigma factor
MGVLLGTQKRLSGSGHSLTLVNLNSHIREVFRIAGFDRVFKIE